MRVLVTTNDAPGHLFPLVPTITGLSALGHEVLVCCPGSAADVLGDVAVRHFDLGQPQVPEFPADATRHERFMFAVTRRWPSLAHGWVKQLLAESHQWEPELILVEPTEHAGRIVASVLQKPWVEHGWGFSLPANVGDLANEAIGDLYAALGASPRAAEQRVDLGPHSLQAPDALEAKRFRYQPWGPPAPPLPPPQGRPRVLITLGTLPVPDAGDLLVRIARAAAAAHAQPVVTLARRHVVAEPWPDVAIVAEWIDTNREMKHSSAVVHHGGAGTSLATIVAGLPALCLPQVGDQFRNAELLGRAGVCLLASDDGNTSEGELSSLIAHALNDSSLLEAVQGARRENFELPEAPSLAQHLVGAVG